MNFIKVRKCTITDSVSNKFIVYDFLMASLIVIYHLGTFFNDIDVKFAFSKFFTVFFQYGGTLAMSYFFTKSGYMLYLNCDKYNVFEKVKRGFFTLLIPFVIWNILVILYRRSIPNLKELFHGFTLDPFDGPLWYVFDIFLLSLLAPVLIRCKYLLLVFAVLQFFNLPKIDYSHWWMPWLFGNGYLTCYFTGAFLGSIGVSPDLSERKYKKVIAVVSMMLLLFRIVFLFFPISSKTSIGWFINRIMFLAVPFCIWAVYIRDVKKLIFPKLLKSSFFLYAMHSPFGISPLRSIFDSHIINLCTNGISCVVFRITIYTYSNPKFWGLLVFKQPARRQTVQIFRFSKKINQFSNEVL